MLSRFAPTTLAEMDAVALLNRTDTKYLLTTSRLGALLEALAGEYLVLEIGGARLHHYQTLYFDTPDFALFRRHHAGAARAPQGARPGLPGHGSELPRGQGEGQQGADAQAPPPHRRAWWPVSGAEERAFVAAHAPVAA